MQHVTRQLAAIQLLQVQTIQKHKKSWSFRGRYLRRKLRIPILPNEERGEERVFYVELEAKGGRVTQRDQKVVAVHIVETPEEAVLAEEKSSGEESVSFDSGTKEVRGIKSSGSFNVTSRNSMDLTMADKVTLNLSSGGGNKKMEGERWSVKIAGSAARKATWKCVSRKDSRFFRSIDFPIRQKT